MDETRMRRIFSNLPELTTDRLSLGKITQKNANDMYAYSSLDEVTRYLLWSPHLNIDDTRGYIEYLQKEYRRGNYGDWGITCKEDGVMIGTIGFSNLDIENNKAEIGYVLNPSYQGKGYMTEAMNAVLNLAFFELKVRRVELRIMKGNIPSERLAKRCGFTFEGTLRDYLLVKGTYRTIEFFSKLSGDR